MPRQDGQVNNRVDHAAFGGIRAGQLAENNPGFQRFLAVVARRIAAHIIGVRRSQRRLAEQQLLVQLHLGMRRIDADHVFDRPLGS